MKNYTHIIVWAGIIIVVIAGLSFASKRSEPANISDSFGSVSSSLSAPETVFDFGTISMARGVVSHAYSIKNNGTELVALSKLYTSCMCTKASLSFGGKKIGPFGMPGHGFVPGFSEVLNPGEEAVIDVAFDPAAHGPAGIGKIERSVILENNGATPLEVKFTATVTP
ncbi:MAG: DUF1573 domain-containing protein [Patescibacteria group bacterium]